MASDTDTDTETGIDTGSGSDTGTVLVRDAWARALKHSDFTDDEDFFLVTGAHSLLVAHIMADVCAATGRRLSLRLFFDNPTVNGLAAVLADTTHGENR
ncbi:phosphopantetheine-binding protein [Streptomyces sp. NPDC046870]|uniref:phosphopantetheine-binding protein n=1 Tax=Streptomyces sp. NPDC046870 TaxID=3155135 RepID=UPI0034521566